MIQLDKREAFPFSSNPFGLVYENAITENKMKMKSNTSNYLSIKWHKNCF